VSCNKTLFRGDKIRDHNPCIHQTNHRSKRYAYNAIAAIATFLITSPTVLSALCRVAPFVTKIQQGAEVAIGL
jgi:hypothetical protein